MPRSEAPQDPRPYIRISCDLPMNPKLDAIDDPAAGWAYVVSLCYCGQSLTDGHFPIRAVLRLANVDKDVADALNQQELWHLPGHGCDRCPQPKPGHAVIHDYLRHQRSGDEVRDLTSKRREAGRRGAARRWAETKAHEQPPGMANAIASAMASAEQMPWQNDGKTMAEERRGEENQIQNQRTPSGASSASPPDATSTPANGSKRGTRIPDDFAVTPAMVEWATNRCPHIDGRLETEKFINYWQAKSGKDATKLDWVATWRNWMLNAAQRAPTSTRAHQRPANGRPAAHPATNPRTTGRFADLDAAVAAQHREAR